MIKLKIAVSDFHLGMGPFLPSGERNYLEDFFNDLKFAEFCEYYSSSDYEKADVELIICGDFFNHLQVDPMEVRPEFLTERVALARTGAMVDGHPKIFEALKKFANSPNHKIIFLVGNHDLGLLWPKVERFVCAAIGGNVRVHKEPAYVVDGIWFEHGSQYVAENWIDFAKPFVGTHETVVNLPWGDLFVILYLNKVKKERPYVDKVFPFKLYLKWAFLHDTFFAIRASLFGIVYFLKVLLRFGEYRRFTARQSFKIIKEFSFPIKMKGAAKKVLERHPECFAVVLGHGHRMAAREFGDGRWYFNTGIWNEMISLEPGTMGRSLRLTFLKVSYDKNGEPHPSLNEWKGIYHEVEEIVSI